VTTRISSHRGIRSANLLAAAVAALSCLLAPARPASASYDDSFSIFTTGWCAVADFVDYGPGVRGNGESNDDYVVIRDYCADSHGVKAWAWQNGVPLGSKYNGNGAAGARHLGSVLPG
jgi:hypothetical protein